MPAERRDLTDSVVLVTGAGAGIGAATVTLLAQAGARVVVADVDAARAEAVAGALPAGRALPVRTDVRRPDDARAAVAAAVAAWGRLDSVVCNAGIGVFGSILDYDDATLAAIVETNLLGTIWMVRAAVAHFDERGGGGDVVVLASTAGLGTAHGTESVYAATKHGQVGFAVALDREVRHRGVRVTSVCPAAVNTGFADGVGRTAGDPVKETYLQPTDVAFAIVTVLQQPRRMRTALWSMWSMSEDA